MQHFVFVVHTSSKFCKYELHLSIALLIFLSYIFPKNSMALINSVLKIFNLQKTKPTQHSVRGLRGLGLTPNILACRSTKVSSFPLFMFHQFHLTQQSQNFFLCFFLFVFDRHSMRMLRENLLNFAMCQYDYIDTYTYACVCVCVLVRACWMFSFAFL